MMDINAVMIIGLILTLGGVGYILACGLDRIEKKLTQELPDQESVDRLFEDYETTMRALFVQGEAMIRDRGAEIMRQIEAKKNEE